MYAYIMTKNMPAVNEELARRFNSMGLTPIPLLGVFDVIIEVNADDEKQLYYDYNKPLTLIEGIKTSTYIAAETWEKEGGDTVLAYIMIEVKPLTLLNEVYNALKNKYGIKKISVVFGDTDIIATIASNDIKNLKNILQSIWDIDGVYRTSTLLNYNRI